MVLWWLGCAAPVDPAEVEALASGAGYWPANSRTAIEGAIALGIPSIELDVVETSDHVPVLYSDPWLDPEECTRWDGTALEERVRIRLLTAEQLTTLFLCGGKPDPQYPNALLVEDSVVMLKELVELLPATGIDQVRLDVYHQKWATPPSAVMARDVLDAWEVLDLPQILSVTSDDPEVLTAFDEETHRRGRDLSLGYVVSIDPTAQEMDRWANGVDYAALAEGAGADTLWLPAEGTDERMVRVARLAGVRIGVGPVDDPRALDYWLRESGVDLVSTSYPGEAP